MKTVELFGYDIISLDRTQLINEIFFTFVTRHDTSSKIFIACANPHSIVVASKDFLFKKALQSTDILLPDGSGIVLAAKVLGLPIQEKIAGYDFFYSFTNELNTKGGARCFFLGSTDHVLKRITTRMENEFPNIEICGVYSPPFKTEFDDEDNRKMISAIEQAKPDVLWVGMTAPKQEKWIYKNRNQLNVPLIGAIGAVFDFYAGTKKRSSEIWIKLGLEWLPRFLREPRRLWERNLKSTPIFLWWVLREKIQAKKTHR